MASIFDPTTFGDIELANRVVMAPLTRNRSPKAIPNNLNVTYYEQRATAGLIVTEGTPVSHQGQGYADVPGLYLPQAIEGWKKVTDAVHRKGGKIVTQIWHVGRVSHTSLQPNGGAPVAPSAIPAGGKTYITIRMAAARSSIRPLPARWNIRKSPASLLISPREPAPRSTPVSTASKSTAPTAT
jgi:N-ethylmaleimide reductase